jgi:hypothetical protein
LSVGRYGRTGPSQDYGYLWIPGLWIPVNVCSRRGVVRKRRLTK